MKIAISYPPLESSKGVPLLSQNRQFQWFSSPTYIYPMIPASAATLLKQNGHQVFWDDGIAEELSYSQWQERVIKEKPDIIAIETKTPVIKRHWKIINDLKEKSLGLKDWQPKIVLMGDHITSLPKESMESCRVDYVLTGGDYDFMLLNLAHHLEGGEPLEPGWWFREKGELKNTGPFQLNHNLDKLPMIDRQLTKWKLYAYKNGNFKYLPGSYLMSARDCWWAKCTFCSWNKTLFPRDFYRLRSVKKALDEVGHLIDLGVKEIMEDSGTLPIGDWLKEFCQGLIERGYNKKVRISCNLRINAIKDLAVWQLMKKAGFRMILFGLESANQETLNRINKGLRAEEIEPCLKRCQEAGLEPHITVMVGYPWETKAEAEKTITLAKKLFKKGWVDSLQATIVIPYPGTPLYQYCQENDLLKFGDYDRFDQKEQVMRSELTTQEIKKLVQELYKSFVSPQYLLRKITNIQSLADIKFLLRGGLKLLGHLFDFRNK